MNRIRLILMTDTDAASDLIDEYFVQLAGSVRNR